MQPNKTNRDSASQAEGRGFEPLLPLIFIIQELAKLTPFFMPLYSLIPEKAKKGRVAPPQMFSQRNDPYCDLLQIIFCLTKI